MTIESCSYRLNGYLDVSHATPTGAAVSYHIEVRDTLRDEQYRMFPDHARDAVIRYGETLDALLSAGI